MYLQSPSVACKANDAALADSFALLYKTDEKELVLPYLKLASATHKTGRFH